MQCRSEETIGFLIKENGFKNEGNLQRFDTMLIERETRIAKEFAEKLWLTFLNW